MLLGARPDTVAGAAETANDAVEGEAVSVDASSPSEQIAVQQPLVHAAENALLAPLRVELGLVEASRHALHMEQQVCKRENESETHLNSI